MSARMSSDSARDSQSMTSRAQFRQKGASVWLIFTLLSLLFVSLSLGILSGTGVFRNWGKKALDNEAEQALQLAMGPLLLGDLTDKSDTFPKHVAGQAAKEVYTFLRLDLADKPEID